MTPRLCIFQYRIAGLEIDEMVTTKRTYPEEFSNGFHGKLSRDRSYIFEIVGKLAKLK
jgi:hypothetical protein